MGNPRSFFTYQSWPFGDDLDHPSTIYGDDLGMVYIYIFIIEYNRIPYIILYYNISYYIILYIILYYINHINMFMTLDFPDYPPVNEHDDPGRDGLEDEFPLFH